MSITIRDLAHSTELDGKTMSSVRGGAGPSLKTPFADVDVNVDVDFDQTINQVQQIQVAALNNIGVIGADFGFKLDLDAKQLAGAGAKA